MNSLILDISAVVIAIAISYGVFWFKNHKTKIDKQVGEGNALAFTIDILGKMVTNFVYDLKDDNEKGANKKKDVMVKVKTALADAKLPIPSDAEISGAIEKAVTTMKLAEKQEDNKNA